MRISSCIQCWFLTGMLLPLYREQTRLQQMRVKVSKRDTSLFWIDREGRTCNFSFVELLLGLTPVPHLKVATIADLRSGPVRTMRLSEKGEDLGNRHFALLLVQQQWPAVSVRIRCWRHVMGVTALMVCSLCPAWLLNLRRPRLSPSSLQLLSGFLHADGWHDIGASRSAQVTHSPPIPPNISVADGSMMTPPPKEPGADENIAAEMPPERLAST